MNLALAELVDRPCYGLLDFDRCAVHVEAESLALAGSIDAFAWASEPTRLADFAGCLIQEDADMFALAE